MNIVVKPLQGNTIFVKNGVTQVTLPVFGLAVYYPGSPRASEVMLNLIAGYKMQFGNQFEGSYGYAVVSPLSNFVMDFKINGTIAGTITANPNGHFVFANSQSLTISAGDLISLVSTSTEGTINSISLTLAGQRT